MPASIYTFSNIYSFSSYDGDADDDSFSSAISDKHRGFHNIHANFSQAYSHPVLPQSEVFSPLVPPQTQLFRPPLPPHAKIHTPQPSPQATPQAISIGGDDESMATAELLSEDGDSDDAESTNSNDDLLSFDSAMQSQTSLEKSNIFGGCDVLSSFSFFSPPSIGSCASVRGAGRFTLPSLPFFSTQTKLSTCDLNVQDSQPSKHLSSNSCVPVNHLAEKCVHSSLASISSHKTSTSYSTFPLSVSMGRTISEDSSKVLNMGRIVQGSTQSTTFASTPVRSTSLPSDLSLLSSGGSIPTSVILKNLCTKTSHAQRNNDLTLPQNSLDNPNITPVVLKSATPVSTRIISRSSSPIVPHHTASQKSSPIIVHKPSSRVSTLDASPKLSSQVSQKPIAPFCLASIKATVTSLSVDPLLDDMSQSSHSSRIQGIKRNLRSMEIKYYREKCVRSLRKSMVHYQKVNDSERRADCDNTSICSELSISHHSYSSKVPSTSKVVSEVLREIMCFNLVLSVACVVFVLYNNSLSKAFQSDENNGTNGTNARCSFDEWV